MILLPALACNYFNMTKSFLFKNKYEKFTNRCQSGYFWPTTGTSLRCGKISNTIIFYIYILWLIYWVKHFREISALESILWNRCGRKCLHMRFKFYLHKSHMPMFNESILDGHSLCVIFRLWRWGNGYYFLVFININDIIS